MESHPHSGNIYQFPRRETNPSVIEKLSDEQVLQNIGLAQLEIEAQTLLDNPDYTELHPAKFVEILEKVLAREEYQESHLAPYPTLCEIVEHVARPGHAALLKYRKTALQIMQTHPLGTDSPQE